MQRGQGVCGLYQVFVNNHYVLTVARRYDTCFLKWYSESRCLVHSLPPILGSDIYPEYLRGTGSAEDNECSTLFKEYSKCLRVSELERELL